MPRPLTMFADAFPVLSETFVLNEAQALAALGHEVRIEAGARGEGPALLRNAPLFVIPEAGAARRLLALALLAGRHPLRCLADLRARSRWRTDEQPRPLRELAPAVLRVRRGGSAHLHAHFAAGAALDAMRIGALLGLPYSVTAHAYDIYAAPRNLVEKLTRAAFATSGCAYTVADLRALAPEADVHEVVMGVRLDELVPDRAAPGGRRLVAVGRLVPKKGFAHLIEAVALLRDGGDPVDGLRIVGDGPERAALEALVGRHGLTDVVELLGASPPDRVREELEAADVLCAPCVIAPDGDRDSAPVVVKEAMAMERLVVTSDAVGLPEFVREPWGRLHPAGDAAGLAARLREVLLLTPAERAAAGRAGREFVSEWADVTRETAKVSALIERGRR